MDTIAGKSTDAFSSGRLALPQPEVDVEVTFTTVPPAQRKAEVARKQEAKAVVAEKAETLRATAPARKEIDARPHPLVRAKLDYCSRLPARVKRWERMTPHQRVYADRERLPPDENGRWILNVPDGLMLTASDEALPWVLGFLDRVFKALARRAAPPDRSGSSRATGPSVQGSRGPREGRAIGALPGGGGVRDDPLQPAVRRASTWLAAGRS